VPQNLVVDFTYRPARPPVFVRSRLPLFVLPAVLLPGALLPLHVFEPRYRRMIAACLESDRRFGVLFHDADGPFPFEVQEGQVGCVAEIIEFRPLPDGRSLVTCRGADRFRVCDGIENAEDFAEALVEKYDDADGTPGDIVDRRRAVLSLFSSLLHETLAADALEKVRLPDAESGDISFRIAAWLRTDPRWHQALLELPTERARLGMVARLLGSGG
jgi:Lon protease-like protein